MAHKKLLSFEFIISILLIGVIFFNLSSTLFQVIDKYTNKDYWRNFTQLEKVFLDSQYVNKKAIDWIPDETAFSYSAGKLIKGDSPVLSVPDKPPLGKYLIGLSALIFNNENIVNLIAAIISLVLIFILGKQIFNSTMIALVAPFLLSFEPIFKNQIIYTPLLDLFQLVFITGVFILFNKGTSSKKYLVFYLLSNVFLGFFISTKFFITGFVVLAALYLPLILNKNTKGLLFLTITSPVSFIVLLLSYSRVLALGYSLMELIGIQKWVYLYHQSFLILPFSIWPLIYLNQWFVWFGDKPVISDDQWVLSWPLLTTISLITTTLYILQKIPHNKLIEVLMSWTVLYLIFLSAGQTFSRYLIILLPFMYIISIYLFVEFIKITKK